MRNNLKENSKIDCERLSGVYKLQSIKYPEKIYIGSSVYMKARRSKHVYRLKQNTHTNKILQDHFNQFGEDDLIFSILTICDKEKLLVFEQHFIDKLKPFFNICKHSDNSRGLKWREDSKEKIRKPKSPEHCKHLSEAAKKRWKYI